MIRKINRNDKALYMRLAKDFYRSDAVLHDIPEEFLALTFEEFTNSDTYLEAYFFEHEGEVAGYVLLAKSFSQEAGGIVVWIEEIYISPEFQGKGLGSSFFAELESNRSPKIKRFRLEVDEWNTEASKLYKKMGFKHLNYKQMIKEFD